MLRLPSEQYQSDITITQSRYNELIIAEREREMLIGVIQKGIRNYIGLAYRDLCMISDMLKLPIPAENNEAESEE